MILNLNECGSKSQFMDTCLLKRALNHGISSCLSLRLLGSLTPLKRDINYRHMNSLPAPDLKTQNR